MVRDKESRIVSIMERYRGNLRRIPRFEFLTMGNTSECAK
jgi:hypothetical protein